MASARTALVLATVLVFAISLDAASPIDESPLSFEANRGQAPSGVRFIARGEGYSILLGASENHVLLRHNGEAISIGFHLLHSSLGSIQGELALPLRVNYLRGADPAKWITDVRTFERVRNYSVYPGIDISYYGHGSNLEYDFVVSPGGNPRKIALSFDHADRLMLDGEGNLHVGSGNSEIVQHRPVVYQDSPAGRHSVPATYRLMGNNTVGFNIGSYDHSKTLLIDPILSYSTFLGGSDGDESANSIATDSSGNVYIAGSTTSTTFPTVNPLQGTAGSSDPNLNSREGFISKLNPAGTALIYSTYFGGSSDDSVVSLAVDGTGAVIVAGTTTSMDFPTTAGALRRTCNTATNGSCADAFVAKLNPAGSALIFSTYLGGNGDDEARGVAVDQGGNIYVAGETSSTNFPLTTGAYSRDSTQGAFVTKMTPAGSIVYSTYFGVGSGTTQIQSIAVDSTGAAYLTGSTPSSSTTATDVFVTKLNTAGSSVLYSSFIRGADDETGNAIAVDAGGNAYVTGQTSSVNFTATPGVVQTRLSGGPFFASQPGSDSTWLAAKWDGLLRSSVYALAIQPGRVVYAGTDDGVVGGLFKFDDNGSGSWVETDAGLTDTRVHALAPQNAAPVYAGTPSGLFRSADGAHTWLPTALNSGLVTSIVIDPTTASNVYAATDGRGVFKSTDSGVTWTAINNGLGAASVRTIVLDPSATKTIYAGTSNGIYKSTDGGANWSNAGTGLFDPSINVLVIDPRNPQSLYAGTNSSGVFRTSNGGGIWFPSNSGLTSSSGTLLVGALTFEVANSTFYAAVGEGNVSTVYKSTNGINWTSAALSASRITALVIDTSDGSSTVDAATVGGSDAFVAKWDPTGALVYSTFLGGYRDDAGMAIAVDGAGNAFIAGNTSSTNFPTLAPVQSAFAGGAQLVTDAFVTKLNPSASALGYSTYLGGSSNDFGNAIALDPNGNAYVAGQTASSDFPTASPLGPRPGLLDAFVARITDSNTVSYAVAARGGYTSSSQGGAVSTITVGYGRITPAANSTTPSGLAIFGFRQNNILVSEAAVPASAAILSGRIYVEVAGSVNTGIAIANPNSQPVTITFSGVAQGTTTIVANGQMAKFLDQAPFSVGANVTGTLTFTASAPVAVVALRGLTNERGEFLITTFPVVDLSLSPGTGNILFPHYADGGGWTTQVVLINPTDSAMSGSVQFFTPGSDTAAVQPYTIVAGGQTSSSFAYSIPARGSYRLQTAGGAATPQSGSIVVAPSTGNQTPAGVVVFSFKEAGVTVSEAGVPALSTGSAFRLYVEASGFFNAGAVGSIQTGVAIANASSNPATVTLELNTLDGASTGLVGTLTIPGNGQVARFIGEIPGLTSLPLPLQGVLRVSTSASTAISVVGLRGRYNEREDFLVTTTAPSNEAVAASTTELFYPHIADGGGYTTQFVLFNGSTDQPSSGTITSSPSPDKRLAYRSADVADASLI